MDMKGKSRRTGGRKAGRQKRDKEFYEARGLAPGLAAMAAEIEMPEDRR
jgi:hypothetical protein